jgi:hypothetical protein
MLPTEQAEFFRLVAATLNAYGRFPETRDLEVWWNECRGLSLDALDSALRSHREDPDRGERVPRPVDITRRMKVGRRDSSQCGVVDVTAGHCAYPGVFTDGTHGEGQKWYCPLHWIERTGEEAAKRIAYSQEVQWETFRERQVAKRLRESLSAPGVTELQARMADRTSARCNVNFDAVIPERGVA